MTRPPRTDLDPPGAGTGHGSVHESVLDAVGDTPLVRLQRLTAGLAPRVYAKLELANPGASVKDRAALAMVLAAERCGALRPGGTIVEATSGNTGVGLALVAAQRGYRALFVVPDKTSPEKVATLRAYGAQVVVTHGGLPREHPDHVHTLAARLAGELPGAWFADQYDNPANPYAHYTGTGPEIWRQTRGMVTHVVAGVGTGGTITGIARFLAQASDDRVTVIGADPRSSVYGGGDGSAFAVEAAGHYRHPDTVDDRWPDSYDPGLVDRVIRVRDRDSLLTARRLAREEGLLVGPSSGTAVAAALHLAAGLDAGALVVVVLPDSGRGYLQTALDDGWLRSRGFLEDDDPAATVRAVADQVHGGGRWPLPPVVADDLPVSDVASRPERELLVVLHGRAADHDGLPGIAAPEVLGAVRPALLAEELRAGRLAPDRPLGAVPLLPVVRAGVGERVADVLTRLPPGGPDLVPVLLDGRAVTALTRDRFTDPSPEDHVPTAADTRSQTLAGIFAATETAVAGDPAAAGVVFRADGAGEEGVLTRVRAGRHTLLVDEPGPLGGGDAAANPVEHALAAIISCQVVSYRFWAARLGVALDDVEVEAEGDLDVRGFLGLADGVRPGFGDVRLSVTLRGPESKERYAALQRAVDDHCPVLDLFSNATPVTTTLTAAPA